VPPERRIEFRVGIHLGDVVEESDGDLMGDGVNIAARLEGIAKPGAICLSEQAYWQVKSRLDLAVSDLGPTQLKNIAEPIRVYSLQVGVPAHTKAAAPEPHKPPPPRLSIVVLPFANIGGDPEQDYFVDGVTESLTTDLSRISGSFVIGRNTAFTYKGKHVDLKQIGRELNVRYVLEGSVQRSGNRLRVNVQLIDAETGAHLWAERFDKLLADLFDMQDEIVARLANQLGAQLIAAEARRAERAPHPDSIDLYYQGLVWFNKGITRKLMTRARDFFERALALDPENVDALIGIAYVDATLGAALLTDDHVKALAAAEVALTKALLQVPNSPIAHHVMGVVQLYTKRPIQAIAEFERALALNPNLANARANIGQAKLFDGRAEETEGDVNEALRLSPRDQRAWLWMGFLGNARMQLGRDEDAVKCFRRSIELNPNLPLMRFFLAAALADLGKLKEAKAEAEAGLALDPTFTVRRFALNAESDNPVFLRHRERLLKGMRKAGVPEQ
jgi:TolB-like protein/cytochrome c-type biogenesis protein CcmH/NrfG